MFKNYLKIALRTMKKQKVYTFINTLGLAIGMACCILLVLYIYAELSIDNYHEKRDRIFCLCSHSIIGGKESIGTSSCGAAAPFLIEQYPEIENAARFQIKYGARITVEEKHLFLGRFAYADDSVFDIFTWPMIKGEPSTALITPYSVVITEGVANACFGSDDPLGKTLQLNDSDTYVVTGVIQNIPENSHYTLDAIFSLKTLYSQIGEGSYLFSDWLSYNFRTYLLLRENVNYREVDQKLRGLLDEVVGQEMKAKGFKEELFLQSLKDIYLRPLYNNVGPIHYVYIFSIIAAFVMLIACVNFINLSTARSANRAREVGIRKVMGSHQRTLIIQFLGESLILCIISLIFALLIVELALPQINTYTRQELSFSSLGIAWLIPGILCFTLFVGIIAGGYPAFFLARFQPAKVLGSRRKSGGSNSWLRRILVVAQFSISITLIIVSALIMGQLHYMKHKDPGFNKEQVIVIRTRDRSIQKSLKVIKEELNTHPSIMSVSASSILPGFSGPPSNAKIPEGYTQEEMQLMDEINVDVDFIPTMGMELVAGRNFSKAFGSDEKQSIIINEAAVKRYGWDNPIGKTIQTFNPYGSGRIPMTVIGVVKDFHLRPLSETIEPLYMSNDSDFPYFYNFLDLILVRVSPDDVSGTVDFIKQKWEALFPQHPFAYFFLDDDYNSQFADIERSRDIFSYFTFIAIFIACLGLFGLASFTAEQRTREIGIRKVLGSSISGIVTLLSKELLLLVCFANVFSWPVAYFMFNRWLQGFPYRISLTVVPFLLSAMLVLVISFLTIAYQTVRAALANPVESLRYE